MQPERVYGRPQVDQPQDAANDREATGHDDEAARYADGNKVFSHAPSRTSD
jgi:hypothetical protein